MSRFDPFDREYAELRIELLKLKLETDKTLTNLNLNGFSNDDNKENYSLSTNNDIDDEDDEEEDDDDNEADDDNNENDEIDVDNESDTTNMSEDYADFKSKNKSSFKDLLRSYNESFCIVSQNEYPMYFKLRSSDLIRYFSLPVCTRADGKTTCRLNCNCQTSSEIGIKIYEKNGVHSFHQFANYIIGYVLEQSTDSLSRVTIEFNNSMNMIKRIYCPCNIHFCPHANAILNFRIKVGKFYAIKLPNQIYNDSLSQTNLIKFYAYLIDEARSLPILRDFQINRTHSNHLLRSGQLDSSFVYAYCSKSLLPIDFSIVEEQARAKKWISDLFARRNNLNNAGNNQSMTSNAYAPNMGIQMMPNSMNSYTSNATNSTANNVTSSTASNLVNPMMASNPISNISMTLNNPLTNAPMQTFFHSSLSVPNFATKANMILHPMMSHDIDHQNKLNQVPLRQMNNTNNHMNNNNNHASNVNSNNNANNSTNGNNMYMNQQSNVNRSHLTFISNPTNGLNIINNINKQPNQGQQQFMKYNQANQSHQPFNNNNANNHHLNYAATAGMFTYHHMNQNSSNSNNLNGKHPFRNATNNLNRMTNKIYSTSNKENSK